MSWTWDSISVVTAILISFEILLCFRLYFSERLGVMNAAKGKRSVRFGETRTFHEEKILSAVSAYQAEPTDTNLLKLRLVAKEVGFDTATGIGFGLFMGIPALVLTGLTKGIIFSRIFPLILLLPVVYLLFVGIKGLFIGHHTKRIPYRGKLDKKQSTLNKQASHIKYRKESESITNLRNIVFILSTKNQSIVDSNKLKNSLQSATGKSSINELPGHITVDFIAGQSNLSNYKGEDSAFADFHTAGSIISKNSPEIKEEILNGHYYGWVDYFSDSKYGQTIAVYIYAKDPNY